MRALRRSSAGTERCRLRLWTTRLALAVLVAIALGYLPYRLLDPADSQRIARLRDQLATKRASVRELHAENDRLRAEIDALRNDPEAVIDRARHDLGMVRPGEIIIRVVDRAEGPTDPRSDPGDASEASGER